MDPLAGKDINLRAQAMLMKRLPLAALSFAVPIVLIPDDHWTYFFLVLAFIVSNSLVSRIKVLLSSKWADVIEHAKNGANLLFVTIVPAVLGPESPIWLLALLNILRQSFLLRGAIKRVHFVCFTVGPSVGLAIYGGTYAEIITPLGIILGTSLLLDSITTFFNKAMDRIEAQSQQLLQAAKFSSLGEMAAGLAHEINTPLGVIRLRAGNIQELLSSRPDGYADMVHTCTQKITTTTDTIAKIIRALQTYSRDSARDPASTTTIADLLLDTQSLVQERFGKQHVPLTFENELDVSLRCRPSEIVQVLVNLLNNALHAVQDLDVKWVVLATARHDAEVEIRITDSGSGIEPAVAERMMDPFMTTKPVGVGTGLGLSVSQGIMEAHHGELKLDASHKNTSFVMLLPIEQEPKAA